MIVFVIFLFMIYSHITLCVNISRIGDCKKCKETLKKMENLEEEIKKLRRREILYNVKRE